MNKHHDDRLGNGDLLLLHGGALGDCVLTLQVARSLQSLGNRVTVAARSSIGRWAVRRGFIDAAISLDSLGLWSDPSRPGTEAVVERRGCAEPWRIISFLGGPDEEISRRVAARWNPYQIIHVNPRPAAETIRNGVHITRQWASSLSGHGFELTLDEPQCAIASTSHQEISKSVLLHPGSGGRAKCCPLEAMERLVEDLRSRQWSVAWMIGPDEVERDGPPFRVHLERSAAVIFEESVEGAADRVAGVDAFIGNDAGMTHVAALAGIRTVALFGPTDPLVWRPLGPQCTVSTFPKSGESLRAWAEKIGQSL